MSTQIIERMAVDLAGRATPWSSSTAWAAARTSGRRRSWPCGSRYRTVRPDLPGSGRSPAGEPLSIDGLADAMMRMAGVLGVERAHFVGHSMGTIVCQHLAATEPQLVRRLALFGPLLAPPDPARQAMRERAAKARAEGMADDRRRDRAGRDLRRHQGQQSGRASRWCANC